MLLVKGKLNHNIKMVSDRLFVPLNSQVFEWYRQGLKRWELRGINGQYNSKYIWKNRVVELRKGYNGESLYGRIGRSYESRSLDKLFNLVDFKEVLPIANTVSDAKKITNLIMGDKEKYILFEILLES